MAPVAASDDILRLDTDGHTVAYRTTGDGPFLFLVGAPVGMVGFNALAERLADRFRVVLHDPRGIALSAKSPEESVTPVRLAEDLGALIAHLTDGPALVFGASGGAVTGLELLAREPARVRGLIAHEPPLFCLLPDDGRVAARAEGVFELAVSETQAAVQGFADLTEALHETWTELPRPSPIPLPPMPEEALARNRFFLTRMAPATVRYRPDIAGLDRKKLVLAAGEASIGQPARKATEALAKLMDLSVADSPGNHLGPSNTPDRFARWLADLLASFP